MLFWSDVVGREKIWRDNGKCSQLPKKKKREKIQKRCILLSEKCGWVCHCSFPQADCVMEIYFSAWWAEMFGIWCVFGLTLRACLWLIHSVWELRETLMCNLQITWIAGGIQALLTSFSRVAEQGTFVALCETNLLVLKLFDGLESFCGLCLMKSSSLEVPKNVLACMSRITQHECRIVLCLGEL